MTVWISHSLQKWKKWEFWQVIALSKSCYWLTPELEGNVFDGVTISGNRRTKDQKYQFDGYVIVAIEYGVQQKESIVNRQADKIV